MLGTIVLEAGKKDLAPELLLDNGKIKLLSYKEYAKFNWEEFRLFCHYNARYGIPTIELVDYLKKLINGRSAIEIGAGAGDLGYHLGIPMTDSKLQEDPEIIEAYKVMQQPLIKYPQDVEKIDSLAAVKKYKPQVVVASWITPYAPYEVVWNSNPFGVREEEILNLVETFIIVGNLSIHDDKPIRELPHKTIKKKWIVSRSSEPKLNRIFVWNNNV